MALFPAFSGAKLSKKAIKIAEEAKVAAEKSADEAKNIRKIDEREVDLPYFLEVKKFTEELSKVTDTTTREVKAGDLKNIIKSLDYLLHFDRFSFLKPIDPIIDHLIFAYRNSPDDYRIKLGNTGFTKVSYLNQIGLKNIIEELEKIKIGDLEN